MAAILDLFFNETLKVINSFGNRFSIKNHVKMRYYIKITTSTWCLAAILNYVKEKMFRSRETLGLFTGNKGGHSEHILKFSALYYFFPFQNLKFLDYLEIRQLYKVAGGGFGKRACKISQKSVEKSVKNMRHELFMLI